MSSVVISERQHYGTFWNSTCYICHNEKYSGIKSAQSCNIIKHYGIPGIPHIHLCYFGVKTHNSSGVAKNILDHSSLCWRHQKKYSGIALEATELRAATFRNSWNSTCHIQLQYKKEKEQGTEEVEGKVLN